MRKVVSWIIYGGIAASLTVTAIVVPTSIAKSKRKNQVVPEKVEPIQYDQNFVEKDLAIYRERDKVDKYMTFRFFSEQENVPYVSVSEYFKEFFNTKLFVTKKDHTYKYTKSEGSKDFIYFDAEQELFSSNNLRTYNDHPDFKVSTGKSFVHILNVERSEAKEKIVNLAHYSIPVYEDGNDAYVPLTFLSQFAGGYQLYNIAYNGKAVYVIDYDGELFDEEHRPKYYGDSYYSELSDMSKPRPVDLAKYNYNELCFVFDKLRGYTTQLVMGDENLLNLGLNGVLETYYPKLKEYLLSTDKTKYYIGHKALFAGLGDGGHTSNLASFDAYSEAVKSDKTQPFNVLVEEDKKRNDEKAKTFLSASLYKTLASTIKMPLYTKNNYYFASSNKTAYINIKEFSYDTQGWDDFYNNKGDIPVETDAFALVRSKLYKAKADGAKNVVLDLTTNGGGNSYAFAGLVGLVNGAKSEFTVNDTFNKIQETEYYGIDINLDGKFDDQDIAEASQFDFNIGVLTSSYSFSCANLFPCAMKELGFKILGEQSGGGSCAIYITSTAEGMLYVHSAFHCLTDKNGSNIDSGVPVDFKIEVGSIVSIEGTKDYSKFYDPETVGDYLASAYIA